MKDLHADESNHSMEEEEIVNEMQPTVSEEKSEENAWKDAVQSVANTVVYLPNMVEKAFEVACQDEGKFCNSKLDF